MIGPILTHDLPLSITTVPIVEGRDRPYADELSTDNLLTYRYRGTDPAHRDNVGLQGVPRLLCDGRGGRSHAAPRAARAQVARVCTRRARLWLRPAEDFLAERFEVFRKAG